MEDVHINRFTSDIIVSDASVLIDYFKANKKILPLVSEKIGRIQVPRPVFDEVDQISEEEATPLGLTIIEPDLTQIREAGTNGGPLSRSDWLAFIVARDSGYVCWTSDARLKKMCEENRVQSCWGLEMMVKLCRKGLLSGESAIQTTHKIKAGGAFIKESVINDFEREIKNI